MLLSANHSWLMLPFFLLMSWEKGAFFGTEHCPHYTFCPPVCPSTSLNCPEFIDYIEHSKPLFLVGCATTVYALGIFLQTRQTSNASWKLCYFDFPA